MKNRSNEQLCALAQKGNTNARDLLLENNFGFIRKTANEIYFGMNMGKSELSIRQRRPGAGGLYRLIGCHPTL